MNLLFQSLRELNVIPASAVEDSDFLLLWNAGGTLESITSQNFRTWALQDIQDQIDDIAAGSNPSYWPQAMSLSLTGAVTGSTSFDGRNARTITTALAPAVESRLGSIESALTGKLDSTAPAVSAARLTTARTITANAGPVRGTFSFNGSANVNYTTSIADGALTIPMTTGLQAALNALVPRVGSALTSHDLAGTRTGVFRTGAGVTTGPVENTAGVLLNLYAAADRVAQIQIADTGRTYIRSKTAPDASTPVWDEVVLKSWFDPDDKVDTAYLTQLYHDRGALGAGIDLNTVISTGVYGQASGTNAANGDHYPIDSPGVLHVYTVGSGASRRIYQTYHAELDDTIYIRRSVDSAGATWVDWRDLSSSPTDLPASAIVSGTFPVARGGTGRATLTEGSYLVGAGTSAVAMMTPAQVRENIIPDNSLSIAKIIGLQSELSNLSDDTGSRIAQPGDSWWTDVESTASQDSIAFRFVTDTNTRYFGMGNDGSLRTSTSTAFSTGDLIYTSGNLNLNQFVQISGNQSNLSGNKSWTGSHRFTRIDPNGTSSDNYIRMEGTTDISNWFQFRRGGSGSNNNAGTLYSNLSNSHWFVHNSASGLQFSHSNEVTEEPSSQNATNTLTLDTEGLKVTRTAANPGVRVVRNNHSVNALYSAETTAGTVYFGQGIAGSFAVGDTINLHTAGNIWLRVNSSGAFINGNEVYHAGNAGSGLVTTSGNQSGISGEKEWTTVHRHRIGNAGTQAILKGYGWNNDADRWRVVLESNGALSFWAYNESGGSGHAALRMETSNNAGTDSFRYRGYEIYREDNAKPMSNNGLAQLNNAWDDINVTGVYYNTSGSTAPTNNVRYSLLHMQQNTGASAQIAIRAGEDNFFIRRQDTTAGWGDWRELHHTGNLVNPATFGIGAGINASNGAYADVVPDLGFAAFYHSAGNAPSDAPVTEQANVLHIGNPWGRGQLVITNNSNGPRLFARGGTGTQWTEYAGLAAPTFAGAVTVQGSDLTPSSLQLIRTGSSGGPAIRLQNIGGNNDKGLGISGAGHLIFGEWDDLSSLSSQWERVLLASDLASLDAVPSGRTITAGNGLSGGGSLAANRTITLATPAAVTLSSTNSVGASNHTHAFTPGGTTSQYIRGDGSLATFPNIPSGTVTSVSGGNGLSGSVTTSGSISLGTPSTITNSTTNSVTSTSHTHALSISKSDVGLSNVENVAISTWDSSYITDSRGASRPPSYYDRRCAQWDFQSRTDTGAGGDSWTALLTVSPWSATSVGTHVPQQLAFTGSGGMSFRRATSDSAWSAWENVALGNTSASDAANTIAVRNGSADIYARLFRSTYGNEPGMNGAVAYRIDDGNNNYIRFCDNTDNFRNWLGMGVTQAVTFQNVSARGYLYCGQQGTADSSRIYGGSSGNMFIVAGNSTGHIYFRPRGWSATAQAYLNNNGDFYANDFVISSDESLKEEIRPFEYRGRLNPVHFQWKEDSRTDFGFIAQQVQKLYPEIVGETSPASPEDGEPTLTLSYPKITAILSYQVNAVEDRVETLEAENSKLRSEVDELKRLVQSLIDR